MRKERKITRGKKYLEGEHTRGQNTSYQQRRVCNHWTGSGAQDEVEILHFKLRDN